MGRFLLASLVCAAAAAAALAPPALAGGELGFADDVAKYSDDGGAAIFDAWDKLGATENRIAVFWDPRNPTVIQEKDGIDRLVRVASQRGVRLVFAVYPKDPLTFASDTDRRIQQYAEYLRIVARTYPQVRNFVVLNEPNEAYFWAPQRDADGDIVSAAVVYRALAAGYDALKSVSPNIVVAGLGLSPDANDTRSTSPVRFLDALGRAYRASGRTRPIMDELDVHFYPRDAARHDHNTSYQWPNIGAPDLDRIKQAVWDAFAGTAQPVVEEAGSPRGEYLKLRIGEIGWQVAVRPQLAAQHVASENVAVTDEQRQAEIYAAITRRLACDKTVSAFHFFHVIDDRDLIHYQTGVLRVDGSERPSFEAVRRALRSGCAGVKQWSRSSTVSGAQAAFEASTRWAGPLTLHAETSTLEDAHVTVALVRITDEMSAASVERVLSGRETPAMQAIGVARAFVRGNWRQSFEFRGNIPRGRYAYVVRFVAAMNAQRTKTLVSNVFSVR